MTIVSPMGQLRPVFADKNGKRLSGGKVYTYEPGTLTPKATYTDALNLIPNTNPIDLDKYGEADIFLNGDYRIRVVDRHGVLIDDYDNLMAWATKRYLDLALSGFASGASKFYPTLADANADIANIAVNQPVNIGELENGGLWFKESTESTTLTKAPYDTLELAKQYSNQKQVVQEQYINDLFAAQTQNVENLINQQGVSLQQLDDYYNYLMQRLAQIAVQGGWDASFVVSADGSNQQQINDRIGNYWYEKPLGYPLNFRVMLDSGDIVKSTAPNNTANPNVDMTGWVKTNDASQIIDASGKTQQEVNNIALDPNLAPLGWTQKDFNDGVIDVRKFIKKDMSNITTGLQAAIEEAYGQKLYIPIPLQALDTIYIERPLILEGNKNTNYNNEYSLDFSLLGAGKDALAIGQTTITSGLELRDMYIKGAKNGGTGLLLGKSLDFYSADFKIENLTLNGFDQAAKFAFVWDGFLNNFRVQNCTNGINHENQVNALLYSQCRIVSIDNFALQFTNAEGVQFDACDVSNLKRLSGSPISLFQSTVTFNTPYFEYIDGPSSISVGSVNESFGSVLTINNPFKLGKNIIVGGEKSYVEINGRDRDNVAVIGSEKTTVVNAKITAPNKKLARNVLTYWTAKNLLTTPSYDGVTPVVTDNRNYLSLFSSNSNGGFIITTGMVVGQVYTLRYSIRKTEDTTFLSIRNPSASIALSSDDLGAVATVRSITFVADNTTLNLSWGGTIDVFGFELLNGNLSEFEDDPFLQADFTRVVSIDRTEKPTVYGIWRDGDTVNKPATNSNPITQWVFHGSVWRATSWATMSLPTASLPVLTTYDVGVEVYDTTASTFKRWNGSVWV